ncbi:MAG: hypothetical protein K2X81_09225, partial [Candidatus Obscuribacterales bacterium]|nr:hypothetical protein [Candidatus Obscuribacterales bacterium]
MKEADNYTQHADVTEKGAGDKGSVGRALLEDVWSAEKSVKPMKAQDGGMKDPDAAQGEIKDLTKGGKKGDKWSASDDYETMLGGKGKTK